MSPMPRKEIHVHIRPMVPQDLGEVTYIEHQSYYNGWIDEDFKICLKQDFISEVAVFDGEIAGFMICMLGKRKISVVKLVVSTYLRRHKIGSQMIGRVIPKLSHKERNRMVVEVEETNDVAIHFLVANRFKAVNVLPDRFERIVSPDEITKQDAYLMIYKLKPLPANRLKGLGRP